MVAKTYITKTLRSLDRAYRSATDVRFGYFFAKLAVLELCGWIEMSMDEIVLKQCVRTVSLESNRKWFENKVRRTYGFDYDQHFKSLLIQLLGVAGYERVEKKLDPAIHTKFLAQLSSLKAIRDQLAHTYEKGTASRIDAPSVTMSRFGDLFAGLKEFEHLVRVVGR